MERRRAELLDKVLMRFMRENGLESPLNEFRLLRAWPDVVGVTRARMSTALYIRNQRLVVRVTSPALRANLGMERQRLVEALNHSVGTDVITDVVFV